MIQTPNKYSAKIPSSSKASTMHLPKRGVKPAAPGKDGVQGEGNSEAPREFNEAESKFVASAKLATAAGAAAPKSEAERRALLAAEVGGKRRAKE